ncbi:MAG: transposase, partial [Prevotella sp.]|nr:transposase [Prevotella sp.]
MSYIQSIYHIIFRTYKSEQTISAEHERELYAVIMEQTNNLHGKIYRIGGMPDHVHILVSLPATTSLAQYVQA